MSVHTIEQHVCVCTLLNTCLCLQCMHTYVLRLQVPVQHAAAVEVVHGLAELQEDGARDGLHGWMRVSV